LHYRMNYWFYWLYYWRWNPSSFYYWFGAVQLLSLLLSLFLFLRIRCVLGGLCSGNGVAFLLFPFIVHLKFQ